MVDTFVFIVAAVVCLVGALGVVLARNPVHSALMLVMTLFGVAVQFVAQEAHFLAAVQVIVYAGAIVVLFLFVIMLMDPKEAEYRRYRKIATCVGTLAIIGLGFIIAGTVRGAAPLTRETIAGETADLGKLLFTEYLLPFEIVSVLLLVAMVGCILLSKREEEAPE